MAVSSETYKHTYVGDGSTLTFNFTFAVFAEADVRVTKYTIADGSTEVLILTSDYTVSLTDDGASGGFITLDSAPSSDYKIILTRDLDYTQETDWVENDPNRANVLENAMDKNLMLILQLREEMDRVILQDTAASTQITFQTPTTAGYFYFDGSSDYYWIDSAIGDINGLTDLAAPAVTDKIAIADADDSNTVKKADVLSIVGTALKDQDNMSDNSATYGATQQSIKAYVDTQIATEDTLVELNDTDLADPDADRIVFWDDSDSKFEHLVANTGLTISGNNLNVTSGLDDIAGLIPTNGNFIVGDGSDWVAESGDIALASLGLSANLGDLTDAEAAQLENIGSETISASQWGYLGAMASQPVEDSTTDTLTNKTIDADNNTISNLEHGNEVDNPSSGVHGVTGDVIGTTDTQTLTNKTIDGDNNTISNLDIGNEVDWDSAGDVSDRSAFTSGDKLLIYEADVGLRKIDWSDLPGAAGGLNNIVEDASPQLGGDLDLNGKNIDFPTTANVSDCLDEDNMNSNSATALATQQSIKAYVDDSAGVLFPTHYERVTRPARTAADIITVYENTTVNVNRIIFATTGDEALDLDTDATWDTGSAVAAASRAGNDYYIYACDNSGSLELLISANSTTPTGYDADTSRKIGGFHCLCEDVGTIAGHTLTDYDKGDILPASVWDLNHKPKSEPEGMVYANSGNWIDIYLPSVSGGELVSVNGGTIADGDSAEKFHPYKFDQWFARISKKPIASLEFVDASIGSNQGTNISTGNDPGSTGGHSDTSGDRMISNIGCEDMCGALGQYGREQAANHVGSAWANAYDGEDSDVAGQHYEAPERPSFGGNWGSGARCGSRCSRWYDSPLFLLSSFSSRGVAEPAR